MSARMSNTLSFITRGQAHQIQAATIGDRHGDRRRGKHRQRDLQPADTGRPHTTSSLSALSRFERVKRRPKNAIGTITTSRLGSISK